MKKSEYKEFEWKFLLLMLNQANFHSSILKATG